MIILQCQNCSSQYRRTPERACRSKYCSFHCRQASIAKKNGLVVNARKLADQLSRLTVVGELSVLTIGKSQFKFDTVDSDRVLALVWHKHSQGYAYSSSASMLMHRYLLDAPQTHQVDHINGDRTDNRRSNLRLATHSENVRNTRCRSSSGYKGVHKQGNRWVAHIYVSPRMIHIGSFKEKIEASRAYDREAKKYFGEFARLNGV